MAYVVFDIGGTKTRVAVASDVEALGEVRSFATPQQSDAALNKIIEVVEELLGPDVVVDGVAGGVRGQLNEAKTRIHHDTILTTWEGEPLAEKLQITASHVASFEVVGTAPQSAGFVELFIV